MILQIVLGYIFVRSVPMDALRIVKPIIIRTSRIQKCFDSLNLNSKLLSGPISSYPERFELNLNETPSLSSSKYLFVAKGNDTLFE